MPQPHFIARQMDSDRRWLLAAPAPIFQPSQAAPEWLPLLPMGDYYNNNADVPTLHFDDALMNTLIANAQYDYERQTYTPIDKNHQIPWDEPNAEAFGFIDRLELRTRDDGLRVLYGHVRYWTAWGSRAATDGSLPYISVAMYHTPHPSTGRSPWLHSVTLCADPYMRDLGPYLALSTGSHSNHQTADNHLEETMDPKLLQALGLAANATVEQAVAAVEALTAGQKQLSALRARAGAAETAQADDIVAALHAAQPLGGETRAQLFTACGLPEGASFDDALTKIKALTLATGSAQAIAERVEKDAALLRQFRADKLVEQARRERLIAPHQIDAFTAEANKNPDAAEAVLANLRKFGAKLPAGERLGADEQPPKTDATFSAGAVALAAKRGRDEAWLSKYGRPRGKMED